jgi:hypothetical protein
MRKKMHTTRLNIEHRVGDTIDCSTGPNRLQSLRTKWKRIMSITSNAKLIVHLEPTLSSIQAHLLLGFYTEFNMSKLVDELSMQP